MYQSDKYVSKNVWMSGYAFYNKSMREKALFAAAIADKTLPVFQKLLNLPKGITFRIAPLKGKNTLGQYFRVQRVATPTDTETTFTVICKG